MQEPLVGAWLSAVAHWRRSLMKAWAPVASQPLSRCDSAAAVTVTLALSEIVDTCIASLSSAFRHGDAAFVVSLLSPALLALLFHRLQLSQTWQLHFVASFSVPLCI